MTCEVTWKRRINEEKNLEIYIYNTLLSLINLFITNSTIDLNIKQLFYIKHVKWKIL